MKTGKLIIYPAHTHQNRKDAKFYTLVTIYERTGNPGGKLRPKDKDSTQLQELLLMKKTHLW